MVQSMVYRLLQYKQWANKVTFTALADVPEVEVYKARQTNFGTIASTLNHIYVVDDIFKAHLLGQPHHYTVRNTPDTPSFNQLRQQQQVMDQWYLDYAASLGDNDEEWNRIVTFEYVGGGDGEMSVADIVLHLVNHGTYHRGFVSDMMYQIPRRPIANDYTIFLRDVLQKS